ncbi:hypothetical protein [Lacrimispora sp. JR3]|uniref:hypothetical protein n=1 Tax=Lacrimispora sinapis TaxID=3111456 RepID=UPI00374A2556
MQTEIFTSNELQEEMNLLTVMASMDWKRRFTLPEAGKKDKQQSRTVIMPTAG